MSDKKNSEEQSHSEINIDGVTVLIDPETIPNLSGSTLDLADSNGQEGFKIDNPNPLWNDPVSMKIQQVLDARVNPSVAMHGGFVSLKEVKDGVAFVILGGGCQGCGMARVTLSQGIDVMIKEEVPEIHEVIDATEHSLGTNPFYQPAKSGESPLAS